MPRQRFIWPDLWGNPTFGRLSPLEQVLYIGLFSMADDDGRIRAEPSFLAATVFPNSTYGTTRVRRARNAIAAAFDHVALYEIDGAEYIALLNWSNWQKPKYPSPSKLPPPPGDSGNVSGNGSGNDSGSGSGNDSPMGRDGLSRVKNPLTPAKRGTRASGTNPRAQGTNPRAGAEPAAIDTLTVCRNIIAGQSWDDATDWQSMRDEIDRLERRHGPLSPDEHHELHTLWKAERERRYPTGDPAEASAA